MSDRYTHLKCECPSGEGVGVKRAVGYIRVSTMFQAKEGESLETQKNQIKEFCNFKGWTLQKIYEDAGKTGAKTEARHDFMQMMADAKAGHFDIVVFTKLSRFARNSMDYHRFQYELEKSNVSLSSIKENIDPTTNNGRLMAGIFALLAEWEREMIREQMAENKIAKWRELRMFNGHAPYGYFWNKKTCKFEENQQEAEVLKLIFSWYTKLGISMREIILKLDREGYRSRRATWSNGTLSGIMQNPCYSSCKLHTNTKVYVDGKRTQTSKSEEDWITFDLPRIVPKSLCDAVEKRREFNITKQKRTTWQNDHWLRGSLHCGRCGARMRVIKGNDRVDGSFPTYYVCHWSCCSEKDLKIEKRERCYQGNVPTDHLEEYIWDRLTFTLTGQHHNPSKEIDLKKVAESYFDNLSTGNVKERLKLTEDKKNRFDSELNKKVRANFRLLELLEDEEVNLSSVRTKLRENEQIIETLKESIQDAENELLELGVMLQDQENFLANKDVLFDIWSDLQDFCPEDKKRMLESLVPDGVTVVIEKNPNHGKRHFKRLGSGNVHFDIVWNSFIFEWLKEAGKLPSLYQNGSHHPAGDERRRDSRNDAHL